MGCIRKVLIFLVLITSIIIDLLLVNQNYVLIQTNNYDTKTSITSLVIYFIIL